MKRKHYIASVFAAILVLASILSWKSATIVTKTHDKENTNANGELFNQYVTSLYDAAGLKSAKLDFNTFKKAIIGYMNLRQENLVAKSLLTVVDFTLPSTEKRMWIIDLNSKKLLFNNLVAHGQGSGDNMANSFSNLADTHQSSLGFYVTSQTYQGKHGLSLKLKGIDNGFNSNAESRAIVLHGAEYVSQAFIDQHGRLGRSFGCPALPVDLAPKIIDTVKGRSCIFINGPETGYNSQYLNDVSAISSFIAENSTIQAKI